MKKVIILMVFLCAILWGCDKREMTFNKIWGEYDMVEYTVDGNDELPLYRDSLGTKFKFLYDDLHGENKCIISGLRNDGREILLGWSFGLSNDNKFIAISFAYGANGIGPIGHKKMPTWEIVKLTSRKMKLNTFFEGKNYSIYLM